jgi:hypothetical protein
MEQGFVDYLHAAGFESGSSVKKSVLATMYQKYESSRGGESFRPTSVPVTNAVTKEVSAALMTSPNSATLMQDPRQQVKPYVGKDGKLYAADLGSRSVAVFTNSDGTPFFPDPKANATVEAIDRLMDKANGRQAEPEPAGNGFWSRLFPDPSPSPSPTAAPTAMPVPAERPMPQQAPTPAAAATPTPLTFSQADSELQFGAKLAPGRYDYDGQLVIITP